MKNYIREKHTKVFKLFGRSNDLFGLFYHNFIFEKTLFFAFHHSLFVTYVLAYKNLWHILLKLSLFFHFLKLYLVSNLLELLWHVLLHEISLSLYKLFTDNQFFIALFNC